MAFLLVLSATAIHSEIVDLSYNGNPGVWMDVEDFRQVVIMQESFMALRREYDLTYGAYEQAVRDFTQAVELAKAESSRAEVQADRAERLYVEKERARAWNGRMLGISIGAVVIGVLTAILF